MSSKKPSGMNPNRFRSLERESVRPSAPVRAFRALSNRKSKSAQDNKQPPINIQIVCSIRGRIVEIKLDRYHSNLDVVLGIGISRIFLHPVAVTTV